MTERTHHVAIIMDGNGRWARHRGRPRVWGHTRGANVVSDIVEAASDLHLKALTMYAFSTENWSRPKAEITILFKLLKKFLLRERPRLIKNRVQFKVIGNKKSLSQDIQSLIADLEEETKNFEGLKLRFAFDYGARDEIVKSVNQFIQKNPGEEISQANITDGLYDPITGDVDLLVRTSGEQRISNFLLWQLAYAELAFTNTLWPDFTPKEFGKILEQFNSRERRFGSLRNELDLKQVSQMSQVTKTEIGSENYVQ